MIYVDKVARFASIKAYVGIGLITAVVKVFAVIATCKYQGTYKKRYN
jgi:hypothetical protein|tara:strand:+ start:24 stop:164 length:141 start_codon:yes stop_codon:yes gene_type:complete